MLSGRKPAPATSSVLKLISTHIWSNASIQNTRIQSLNRELKSLSDGGFFEQALDLYRAVRLSHANPDNYTFPFVLKACGGLSAIDEGMSIHSHMMKCGFDRDLVVMNCLIEMYSQAGSLISARGVFDGMPRRNSASWNLMISGYGANGYPTDALELCGSMKDEGMALDRVGLTIVLPICGQVKALRLGESIHAHVIVSGWCQDTALLTALLDIYAKCGELEAAELLFDGIPHKDVVSWNALITGYSQVGRPELMLELFKRMISEGFAPSSPTVLLSLQACTHLSVLAVGKAIHGCVVRRGFSSDVSIEGLLIDMYSKLGELDSSCRVFTGMPIGNLNSWSCMLNGFGMHGRGREALMVFFGMLKRGIEPDGICFLLVLASCSHCRLLREGRQMFGYMVSQFGIQPRMEHYACMVDLMGRSGCVDEAFRFLCGMPMEPDSSVVGAFLGACRTHGRLELAKVFEDCLAESGRTGAGFYKLLLEIYAGKELWDEVVEIRSLMENERVKGTSGCSLIELYR